MKLFESFQANKELLLKTKYIKAYSVKCNDKEYTIILTRKVANKRTSLYFIDSTIYWKQRPRFLNRTGYRGERIAICKFDTQNIANTLFVVRGTPLHDEGLDNGIFRSTKKYDEKFVNCMTYDQFMQM